MGRLMNVFDLIRNCLGFDWDDGNEIKNWSSHRVSQVECEAVFLNEPFIKFDREHSLSEKRFMAFGKTDQDRYLFVAFTLRKRMIRVISARDMTKSEFREYEKHEEKTSKL